MSSDREIAFAKYWEGKQGRRLTIDVVKDAYLAGWSDRPYVSAKATEDTADLCQTCGYDKKCHDYVHHVLGACANFRGSMMSEDKEYTPPSQPHVMGSEPTAQELVHRLAFALEPLELHETSAGLTARIALCDYRNWVKRSLRP